MPVFSFAPWEGFLISTMKELGSQLIKALNFMEIRVYIKRAFAWEEDLGIVNIKQDVLLVSSSEEALGELR